MAHIPWVPYMGRMPLPQHRGISPMTLSCMQGMGQLSRVREELQHPWIEPELFSPAPYPTCTHTSNSNQGPSLCRVLGQRGG